MQKKEGSTKTNDTYNSNNKHNSETVSNNESVNTIDVKTETNEFIVNKLPSSEKNPQTQPEINNNIVQLLKRATFALEDGDFKNAD